jgi:hypothetical protein
MALDISIASSMRLLMLVWLGMLAALILPAVRAQQWSSMPQPLPSSLGEVAAAVDGDKLYLLGSTSTFIYNLALNSWSTGPSRPGTGDHHTTLMTCGGKLVVVGGLSGSGNKQVLLVVQS